MRWIGLIAGAAAVSVVTAITVSTAMRAAPARPQAVQRYPIALPASSSFIGEGVALSPDGAALVYAARESGKRVLYLRHLDQVDSQPIRAVGLFGMLVLPVLGVSAMAGARRRSRLLSARAHLR